MKRRSLRPRSAFTLVELLIVIGLIIVLVGILLPVVGKVRDSAYTANSHAQVVALSGLIDAYYGDFNGYPGPLSYTQVYSSQGMPSTPPVITAAPMAASIVPTLGNITGTENLVLGLLGGFRLIPGAMPTIQYNTEWVGKGPGSLGQSSKKLPPYGDTADLSTRRVTPIDGDFVDGNGVTGFDSIVPEYVDRFPEGMPVLYLRARTNIRPGMTDAANPIATFNSRYGQYDTTQVYGYVNGTAAQAIGVGKSLPASDYNPPSDFGMHGFRTATYGTTTGAGAFPLNLYAALRHPNLIDTPKNKDRYILISPGRDRVYGTNDDVTNFGAY